MTDSERRSDVYLKLRPFLWMPIDTRARPPFGRPPVWVDGVPIGTGSLFPRDYRGNGYTIEQGGPFTWSPTKPPPNYKGSNGPFGTFPAKDFGNPDYQWGHPDYEEYLRGYERLDERRAEQQRKKAA